MSLLLTKEQIDFFYHEGYLVLRSFYDVKREIEPIQKAIHGIIGIIIRKYDLPLVQKPFSPQTFDSCFQELLAHDRKIGSEIYDAVKGIPAFVRLSCNEKHDRLVSELRPNAFPGVAAGGYGIRMDHPFEEKYRAAWHQDYPSQLRSIDGLVFWSSLVPVTEDIGPLQICQGSHKEGLVPLYKQDPRNPEKTGTYALVLKNEEELINKYPITAPLSEPSDLIILDFLTIHGSGYNVSKRSRWTMQMRYFNYNETTGIRIGWSGSFAAGKSIESVHPELIIG